MLPAPRIRVSRAHEPAGLGLSAPVAKQVRSQVACTQVGLTLALLGVLIEWFPVLGLAGAVLILLGLALLVQGSGVFGAKHHANVVIAVVLTLMVFAGFVILLPGSQFRFFRFVWETILDGLWAVVLVLLGVGLLGLRGQVVLWGAFGAHILVGAAYRGGGPSWVLIVGVIPSVLFASAYYSALTRISRGEVPVGLPTLRSPTGFADPPVPPPDGS